MSATRPREKGFSKDADQLVRRLSLVALLLSRGGQPVAADQIQKQVEGYALMTDEAFKRRFYEDRAELARLGIQITAEPGSDGGGEVYRLPADAYYLPPIALTQDELTALSACLSVLEDRFSYSQPLRLALLSLAQGRPELMAEAAAPALTVLPEAGPGAGTAVLPKLQAAVAERKTVLFDYYAISRDETLPRRVDPYGLQLIAGEWYLVGYCHLREGVRVFRLSRIRSRVTHATRAPHDFEIPSDFDLSAFSDRPPWQLAPARHEARLAVSPTLAWWVEAHWSHCGTITAQDGGSIIYETAYASGRALLSWVLGLGDAAHILAPAALRDEAAQRLRALREALTARPPLPPAASPPPPKQSAGRTAADWHVEVDRFTRLHALATYLLQACPADDEVVLRIPDILADLHVARETLIADVRLLNLVNFAGGGTVLYAEPVGDELSVQCDPAGPAFKRPARLTPLQADTLLLAVELVGGQLPTAAGAALAGAADKLRAARSGTAPVLAGGDLLPPDEHIFAAVNGAIQQHRLLAIEYWVEGTDRLTTRTVEPYLLVRNRGEWYYVCWCRLAGGTRVFRVATTKQAHLLDETFTPRADVELDLYRRDGIPTSRSYAPASARIHYSPKVSRWIAERQPVQELADGSCVASQPYVDDQWLAHYLLHFAGEALPLEPPAAVATLAATVDRMLAAYAP